MSTVRLSRLIFIGLKCPQNKALELERFVTTALQTFTNKEITALLANLQIIKVSRSLYAFEHFYLLKALQQQAPDLLLPFTQVAVKSIDDATRKIIHHQTLAALASLDSKCASSIEKHASAVSTKHTPLFKREVWSSIHDVHRSTLNNYDDAFTAVTLNTDRPLSSVSLSEALEFIPSPRGSTTNE